MPGILPAQTAVPPVCTGPQPCSRPHVLWIYLTYPLFLTVLCSDLFVPAPARSDELRALFERYGEVRDVYLPRDYYTE